jgi:hypothetical protein
VRVGHDPQQGDQIFGIGSTWWHSLQSGDEELLEIAFGTNAPWESMGMVHRAGGAATLYLRVDQSEFFAEMRDSATLTVSSGRRALGVYAYQGFGAAMEAIVECQKTINQAVDPFSTPSATEIPATPGA